MRNLFILLIMLGLFSQTGCTSQARKTHLVFERENVTYYELLAALEDLKPIGQEGSTSDQYKAANALRHIAKYMDDPAKREMGARALVFLAFFNSDRNVKLSCLSRIEAILEGDRRELALKIAIINELERIITAESGYSVTETSVFSKDITRYYVYPEIDSREEALEFLMDLFEDLEEYLQYSAIRSFKRILDNPATCYELDDDICEEDDDDDQRAWKQVLREHIGDWLEENTISPMVKTSLVRLVEASAAAVPEVEDDNPSRSLLEDWATETDIPEQTRSIIAAALNRLDNSYPDLFPLDSQTALVPFTPNQEYSSLDNNNAPEFWYANVDQILNGQLFRGDAINNETRDPDRKEAGDFMQVPAEWILYGGYSNDPSSKELKSIIFNSAIQAFKKGFVLSPAVDLQYSLDQLVSTSAGESDWALERSLAVISGLYPGLQQSLNNIDALVGSLAGHIKRETNIHRKRLFIYALIDGLPYFRDSVEYAVCPELEKADFLTQHLTEVRAAKLNGPIEPLTVSEYRRQISAGTSQYTATTAGESSGQYFQTLCGYDITGLARNRQGAEAAEEQEIEEGAEAAVEEETAGESSL